MTAAPSAGRQTLATALAVQPGFGGITADDLAPLPRKGVSHAHYSVRGHPLVARVPRLSQWDLDAARLIEYEAAAFTSAGPSGHTPKLRAAIPPAPNLPSGALLVDRIDGRPPRLPGDMAAIAAALAAIHAVPVPPDQERPPLEQTDPVAATVERIARQADHLSAANVPADTRMQIEEELAWARRFAADRPLDPVEPVLVGTDTHPGNFLIDAHGTAWFVDLEKAAYGNPALDLAHASLPTSTGWDPECRGDLTADDVAAFYARYREIAGPATWDSLRPWLAPARRLIWLRTITWFARWRGDFAHAPAAPDDPAWRAHIERHIDTCLEPAAVAAVRTQWTGPEPFTLD